jgi:hypothetical protein
MAILTSREVIKQDVIQALAPRDEAIAKLPTPLRTTSAGSTTTLVDTKLGRGTTQANRYDGRDVEIMTDIPAAAITSSSVANPTVITATAHGLSNVPGRVVIISGHYGSTPDINGEHVMTWISNDTFSIPVNVTDGGAGGTVVEQSDYVGVDDTGFNGTSTLTYSPTVPVLPATATKYLIYPLGLGPERLEQIISDVLRETVGSHVFFPSLAADPDLTNYPSYAAAVDAGVIATVGTPSTNAYVTTSAGVFMGERAVHIIADGADEGFETADFSVTDTETLLVSVFVWVNVGSMDVVLWDSSGGAALKTVIPDEPAWTEVRFTQAVGSGVEQCKLQFVSNDLDDDFYVSAPIIVQSTSQRNYDSPSWLTYSGQVAQFRYLDAGPASGAGATPGDMFIPLGVQPRADHAPGSILNARGVHQVKLAGLIPADNRPVYAVAMRQFDDIITNAATTPADRQYLRSRVIATILRDWGDPKEKAWSRRAHARAEALEYNLQELRIVPNPLTSV